jgi:hypothetical protein
MLQIDIWKDRKIYDNQGRNVRDEFLRKLKDLKTDLVSDLISFCVCVILLYG